MCIGPLKKPKMPAPPPPPVLKQDQNPRPPKDVKRRRAEERQRMAALAGDRSTVLTGAQGVLAPANVGQTSLLSYNPPQQ